LSRAADERGATDPLEILGEMRAGDEASRGAASTREKKRKRVKTKKRESISSGSRGEVAVAGSRLNFSQDEVFERMPPHMVSWFRLFRCL